VVVELKISVSGPYHKRGKCGKDMVPTYTPLQEKQLWWTCTGYKQEV